MANEKKIVRVYDGNGVPLDVDLTPAEPGPEWVWPTEDEQADDGLG